MFEKEAQRKDLVETIPVYSIQNIKFHIHTIYCRFIIRIKLRFITLIYCITGIN